MVHHLTEAMMKHYVLQQAITLILSADFKIQTEVTEQGPSFFRFSGAVSIILESFNSPWNYGSSDK